MLRRWLVVSCALAGLVGTAAAQETAPAAAPKRVEVKVELRWRNEFRDNADFQPADDFDHFLSQRIRVWLLVRAHSHLSFTVEGQDVWLFDAASDKIIHNTATNLHQAYLDWKPGGSEYWELRAGRQEFIYGRERLLGAFNWDNVGRSFDAARLRHRRAEWTSDFFWGRLVDIRRASARHRPGNQDLYGIYVSRALQGSPGQTEIYAFVLHDGLRSGGERGPDRHRAAAFIGSGGYAWGGRWQPSLDFEYDFATGDNDPADGRSDEFHNLFPTNHLHYGYADLVGLRNLHDFRFTATTRLHPKLILQGDYHRFLLAEPRGPWKNAGGRVLGFDRRGSPAATWARRWTSPHASRCTST